MQFMASSDLICHLFNLMASLCTHLDSCSYPDMSFTCHECLGNHCHSKLMSVCVYACRLARAQVANGEGPSGLNQAQPGLLQLR